MPDLRKDPIVGRWVIIAMSGPSGRTTSKARRSVQKRQRSARSARGNEDKTPPEILAYREHGSHANRAGLAHPRRAQQVPRAEDRGRPEQARRRHLRHDGGVGAHEVIIE